MKHTATSFAVLLVLAPCCRAQEPPSTQQANAERPRLVVLCAIDQLATWTLAEALPFCGEDGGFRRLARAGVTFDRCAFQHGCTETGPGHATLGTGAPANVHGIVKNQWFDPATGAKVYCAGDTTTAPLPGMREGEKRSAANLLVPTVGDVLKEKVAGALVASVAWKDRSAILMAGAKADFAGWFEVTTGRFVTNTAYCKEAPRWLTAFDERKAIDSFHGWTWDRVAPPAAYEGLVDDRPFEAPHQNGANTRTLPQVVTGGKPEAGPALYASIYTSPLGNEVVLLAAQACVEGMSLGADDVPDLLCVSFSSLDLVGHYMGPDSVEYRDTLLRLDGQLARLLDFLDAKVGAGKWAFILASDHGIGLSPEAAKAKGLDGGRGLLQTQAKAAAETAITTALGGRAAKPFVLQASEMGLFLDPVAILEKRGERSGDLALFAAARAAAEAAAGVKGIQTAFVTADLLREGPGDDPIRRAMWYATHPVRAGDVLLIAKPYWLDGVLPATHGSPHAYDREVPLFAAGPGLRAGARSDAAISPGLAAVLAARFLGIPKPPAAAEDVPADVLAER